MEELFIQKVRVGIWSFEDFRGTSRGTPELQSAGFFFFFFLILLSLTCSETLAFAFVVCFYVCIFVSIREKANGCRNDVNHAMHTERHKHKEDERDKS